MGSMAAISTMLSPIDGFIGGFHIAETSGQYHQYAGYHDRRDGGYGMKSNTIMATISIMMAAASGAL